jgi:hypothetical protein
MRRSYSGSGSAAGCTSVGGCWLFIIIFNLTLGAYCFDYSMGAVFGKHVGWALSMLGGLVLGELTVPLAIVLAIVGAAGVAFPLVH